MTYTPEFQLLQEYCTARNELKKALQSKSSKIQAQVMADLDRNYADLIRIQNKRIMETPSIRL